MRASRCQAPSFENHDGAEISSAAIAGYALLRRLVGGRIETPIRLWDGGLICEKRITRARSILWHATPTGRWSATASTASAREGFIRRRVPGSPERH